MQDALERMNDSGTCTTTDTPLTQPRSGFDPIDTRRKLIAMRVKAGAKTPRGHACSNLVEQLDHFQTATGAQREHLARAIPYQMARLSGQQ